MCEFPLSNPTHCPRGPAMLTTPQLLINSLEVLVFSLQGLGQRPGAAGRLQVFGFICVVATLLLVGIDVDAVQTPKEQQQRQDDNNCGMKTKQHK